MIINVSAAEDLQPLAEATGRGLEAIIAERKELGLSLPPAASVKLSYCISSHKSTSAETGNEPHLTIGVLRSIRETTANEEHYKSAGLILDYFDDARFLFGRLDDDRLAALTQNPREYIANFESSLGAEALRELKERLTDECYADLRERMIDDATSVTLLFSSLLPELSNEFRLPPNARHEFDHLAFATSPLHKNYLRAQEKLCASRKRNSDPTRTRSMRETCSAPIRMLRAQTTIYPLYEIRALFFDHISPGAWKDVDYDRVISAVENQFQHEKTAQSLVYALTDYLIDLYDEELDSATEHYLWQHARMRNGSNAPIPNTRINHSLARRILYEELSEWQARAADSARTAALAIGTAYKEDSTRLARAENARTAREFIDTCLE